jgi:hypothetical protein
VSSAVLIVGSADLAASIRAAVDAPLDVAADVKAAVLALSESEPEAVVVDAALLGAGALGHLRTVGRNAAIVVVGDAGAEHVELLAEGADDVLGRDRLDPHRVRRALIFASTRRRQEELRALQLAVERESGISDDGRSGEAPGGDLRRRFPAAVAAIQTRLGAAIARRADAAAAAGPDPKVERIAASLFDLDAGRRDVTALHVRALAEAAKGADPERARALAVAARAVVLEVSSALVDRYRAARRPSSPPPEPAGAPPGRE